MSLMDEVTTLQERLATAQRERNRAEGAYETALAIVDTAHAELRRDFGVDTAEAAEDLLGEMKAELARIVVEMNEALDRIGVA